MFETRDLFFCVYPACTVLVYQTASVKVVAWALWAKAATVAAARVRVEVD
jgi:hypothetical protein